MKNIISNEFKKIDIILNDTQVEQFIDYYNILVEWNSFMNLTGITEFHEVIIKHFIDSVCIIKCKEFSHSNLNSKSLIDIGTGAGFPGLPLKIVFPELNITLLDSLQKRVNFLDEVIKVLNLSNIETVHGRAEDYSKLNEYRDQYDFAVSRAVSNLSTLSEYCLPFVKKDGYFIPFKSEKVNDEISSAQNAIKELKGEYIDHIEYDLSGNFRSLVIIKKIDITPNRFPRKAGIALKKPIT